MSDIKDKLVKEVNTINETITDEKEKKIVMDAIQNMISVFTQQVVELSERQTEAEARIEEVLDMLSSIEDELIENFSDDLQVTCPYCGEEVPLKFPDDESSDFECPNCHNVIELEVMLDGKDGHCGLGCSCGDCHDDCCDCDDDDCCDCDDCDEE